MSMMLRRGMLSIKELVDSMILLRTYNVQESWENDTEGIALAEYNLLMKDIIDAGGSSINCVVAIFENNTANSSYRADYIVAVADVNGIKASASVRNNKTNNSNISADRRMWASAGTTIKVYAAFDPNN